jgi:hypothetical protein
VLGVSSAHVFQSSGKRRSVSGTAADIASTRRSSDWRRLSAGDGTKGPRLHDWCYLELADLDAQIGVGEILTQIEGRQEGWSGGGWPTTASDGRRSPAMQESLM